MAASPDPFDGLRRAAALGYHLPAGTVRLMCEMGPAPAGRRQDGQTRVAGPSTVPWAVMHPAELRALVAGAWRERSLTALLDALELPPEASLRAEVAPMAPLVTAVSPGVFRVEAGDHRSVAFATLLDPGCADEAMAAAVPARRSARLAPDSAWAAGSRLRGSERRGEAAVGVSFVPDGELGVTLVAFDAVIGASPPTLSRLAVAAHRRCLAAEQVAPPRPRLSSVGPAPA